MSIAVLTDDNFSWRPDCYREELWGCSIEMKFLSIKLLDYWEGRAALAATDNPFGIVILAHLNTLETQKDPLQRRITKASLTKTLLCKGWDKKKIWLLYQFLDYIMALPAELELEYHQEIEQFEGDKQMQ